MKNIEQNAPRYGTQDFNNTRLSALESILRPGLTLAGMLKMVTVAYGDIGLTHTLEHLGLTITDMVNMGVIPDTALSN